MAVFMSALNDGLIAAHRNILRLEEQAVKTSRIMLSISELHLIESIGSGGERGVKISKIAEAMGIKPPSATVAVNKLEKKGYVEKFNCENDGRVVYARLTREGKKVNAYHSFYHRKMVRELSQELSEEEKDCLIRAIRKMNQYFERGITENEF